MCVVSSEAERTNMQKTKIHDFFMEFVKSYINSTNRDYWSQERQQQYQETLKLDGNSDGFDSLLTQLSTLHMEDIGLLGGIIS